LTNVILFASSTPNIVRMKKPAGHVAHMWNMINTYKGLVRENEAKRPLRELWRTLVGGIMLK